MGCLWISNVHRTLNFCPNKCGRTSDCDCHIFIAVTSSICTCKCNQLSNQFALLCTCVCNRLIIYFICRPIDRSAWLWSMHSFTLRFLRTYINYWFFYLEDWPQHRVLGQPHKQGRNWMHQSLSNSGLTVPLYILWLEGYWCCPTVREQCQQLIFTSRD
jgi:hypothetical protein